MAWRTRFEHMNIRQSSEAKIARRILEKHSLVPPVDIHNLLNLYAKVSFKIIPIEGVDGIALNIKVPGKFPLVIINEITTYSRQRFTMAHELGHLVIPWHTGIKIDKSTSDFDLEASYSMLEAEANRFAAELLMPADYIINLAAKSSDLANAHKIICKKLKVSPYAAAVQIGNVFPPGLIYCAVENNVVIYAGQTKGTNLIIPVKNQKFLNDTFIHAKKKTIWKINDLSIYWWELDLCFSNLIVDDGQDWRSLLDEIVIFKESQTEREKYKRSINGIIANINSKKRHENNYNLDSLLDACRKRFNQDEEHLTLVSNSKFESFLKARLVDLLGRYI